MANYSVFGVGNPLMDVIGRVPVGRLVELGANPGTMALTEPGVASDIAASLQTPVTRPGGSCANTLRGIAWMARGGTMQPALMTGAIGTDSAGDRFESEMQTAGVATRLPRRAGQPTGLSVVLVTPDGERTMFTSLGASQALGKGDIDLDALADSGCFYSTAYLWGSSGQREALFVAAEAAQSAGALVAFDVADPFVAETAGAELVRWVPSAVDLLFANEQEARTLVGVLGQASSEVGPDREFAPLAALAPTVVVKLGARGSMVWRDGRVAARVEGLAAEVKDTTGAGDSFAAGFLFATLRGCDAGSAAALGNQVAAAIVEADGCDYSSVTAARPA